MNILRNIAYTLVLIGAINWGLVGFFQIDLVSYLLGDMTVWSRIVYGLIGLSAVYAAFTTEACERTLIIEE